MPEIICCGCGQLADHHAKGRCDNCYAAYLRTTLQDMTCVTCGRSGVKSRGMCGPCYRRQLLTEKVERGEICAECDRGRPVEANGRCSACYKALHTLTGRYNNAPALIASRPDVTKRPTLAKVARAKTLPQLASQFRHADGYIVIETAEGGSEKMDLEDFGRLLLGRTADIRHIAKSRHKTKLQAEAARRAWNDRRKERAGALSANP